MDFSMYTKEAIEARKEKSAYSSYRQEMVAKFHERLAPGYKEFTGRELSGKSIALKLSHVKTDELEFFYKKCSSAKSFSSCFWGCLKT